MLTQLVIWLNALANWTVGVLLSPVAWLPGWLSATLVAAVTGVTMLYVFKLTSNQAAIGRTRNQISACLLGLSLFKEDFRVGLKLQISLIGYGLQLLLHSLIPMLVMTVPMVLILSQLALWYQARPLKPNEEAIVAVFLNPNAPVALQTIQLEPPPGTDVSAGPVRVASKSMACWQLQSSEAEMQLLTFTVGAEQFTKELAVGNGFSPVSLERPGWNWLSAMLHPREQPFPPGSAVQSIEVTYPERISWIYGTHSWLWYWFLMSLVAAFIAKPFLGVNL